MQAGWGWGSNGVTVTGLHKVTAIFSNCIVTGLHFQNKECNGTWGYLMGEKLRYSTYVCHQKCQGGETARQLYFYALCSFFNFTFSDYYSIK